MGMSSTYFPSIALRHLLEDRGNKLGVGGQLGHFNLSTAWAGELTSMRLGEA